MTLFDPGWRGEQTKGPEDSEWGVVDLGNDPTTIVERSLLLLLSHHTSCSSVFLSIEPISMITLLLLVLQLLHLLIQYCRWY